MDICLIDTRPLPDQTIDDYLAWLNEDELARYRRFVRRERQRQFVTGRVLLRRMLGQLLGVPVDALQLEERVGMAPRLMAPHQIAGFSISHSGGWVACAASRTCALGLDIELIDPARDTAALAAQAFDAAQIAWLAARPMASRLRDFYTMWSDYEARLKLQQPAVQSIQLFHEEISIVLCSAQPLAGLPRLRLVTLDG